MNQLYLPEAKYLINDSLLFYHAKYDPVTFISIFDRRENPKAMANILKFVDEEDGMQLGAYIKINYPELFENIKTFLSYNGIRIL